MSEKKKKLLEKAMTGFHKHGGGTDVDPRYAMENPEDLKNQLQASFDSIFPELMKKSKHRKHIIFDDDVFKVYEELSQEFETPFSSLINSALRSFAKEKMFKALKSSDPVAELLSIRDRERELLDEIKALDLTQELEKRLG